jgi:hypothetical protein
MRKSRNTITKTEYKKILKNSFIKLDLLLIY